MAERAPAAFFSYSRDDSSFVVRLAADLKAAGANVWLDQMDIVPGQRWDRAIEDALKNCPRLIVILSPASVESTNVMDEVSFALEKHKTVIPVTYKECEIPFRLGRLQYVDFKQDQDYARALKELFKVLAPPEEQESSTVASPNVRDQIRTDIPKMKEPQLEAEQARLPILARDSGRRFLAKLPRGAKVGVVAFVILILVFVLYWVLQWGSNRQTQETQKREPVVTTTNPASNLPQRNEGSQKQEPQVEATGAMTVPRQQKAKTPKREAPVVAANPSEAAGFFGPHPLHGKWDGTGTLWNGTPCSVEGNLTLLGFDVTIKGDHKSWSYAGEWEFDLASRTLTMRGGEPFVHNQDDQNDPFVCHLTAEDRRSLQGTCTDTAFGTSFHNASLRLTHVDR